jgi:hypothetical protein
MMRRMTLMAASWPSKSDAAVTMRTWCVGLYGAAAAGLFTRGNLVPPRRGFEGSIVGCASACTPVGRRRSDGGACGRDGLRCRLGSRCSRCARAPGGRRESSVGVAAKTPGFAALSVHGIRGSPRATVGGHPAPPGCRESSGPCGEYACRIPCGTRSSARVSIDRIISSNPAEPGDHLQLLGVSRGSRAPRGRRTPELSRRTPEFSRRTPELSRRPHPSFRVVHPTFSRRTPGALVARIEVHAARDHPARNHSLREGVGEGPRRLAVASATSSVA